MILEAGKPERKASGVEHPFSSNSANDVLGLPVWQVGKASSAAEAVFKFAAAMARLEARPDEN